jgi:hypothetical protein
MVSSNRTGLIIAGVVGLVLGLLLGMLLFWVLFPVQWTNANSYDLAPQAKAEYVALVADSYSFNKDQAAAAKYFEVWTVEEKEEAFAGAIVLYEEKGDADKVQAINDLAMVLAVSVPEEGAPAADETAVAEATAEPGATAEAEAPVQPEATPPPGIVQRLRVPCLVFFAVLLILVLAWIGFRIALRRRAAAEAPQPALRPTVVAPPVDEWEGTGQPPLKHVFTTYELGEDTYDESASIETPMGEFLGEMGVGISETVGTGDPDKVTAFEVWLFDKSDIRTVTKVLMSEHAFNDEGLRTRLASKGEAVLAQPGSPLTLETSGLQVRVNVTELMYGEGEAPAKSFFSKLTVELMAYTKPAASDERTL